MAWRTTNMQWFDSYNLSYTAAKRIAAGKITPPWTCTKDIRSVRVTVDSKVHGVGLIPLYASDRRNVLSNSTFREVVMPDELFSGFSEAGWDEAPWDAEPTFTPEELQILLTRRCRPPRPPIAWVASNTMFFGCVVKTAFLQWREGASAQQADRAHPPPQR
jgi:hypothetical protein